MNQEWTWTGSGPELDNKYIPCILLKFSQKLPQTDSYSSHILEMYHVLVRDKMTAYLYP